MEPANYLASGVEDPGGVGYKTLTEHLRYREKILMRFRPWVSTLLLVIVGAAALAQEEQESSKRSEYRPRLPANWTQIGLSDEQVRKIRAAQIRCHDELEPIEKEYDELRERLSELRTKMDRRKKDLKKELFGVLTPEQIAKLDEIELEKFRKAQEKRRELAGQDDEPTAEE